MIKTKITVKREELIKVNPSPKIKFLLTNIKIYKVYT